MRGRLIAAAVALTLAVVGTVVLLSYVKGVNARAVAKAAPQTVEVLVAAQPIAAGAPGERIRSAVATVALPVSAALADRVTDLAQVAGQVALIPIQPGEQLLQAKFGTPQASSASAPVLPATFQQVTVLLRPEQALAGRVRAGQTVGVFVSLDKPEPGLTHLTVQKVLVTAVQPVVATAPPATTGTTATTPAPDGQAGSDAAVAADNGLSGSPPTTTPSVPDPTLNVMVTLALSARDAEKVVFGAEHGSIWLSDEPASADGNGTEVVDGVKVFK